ncbi:MAG: hypothetical protein ACI39H_00050 [Lachnospiraceae bacterium]
MIIYFQKEYVKAGKFDTCYSKYLSQVFQVKNQADYEDFYIVSQKDATEQYEKADEFVQVIESYLESVGRG